MQDREPESSALRGPSAVAIACGLGWDWQAAAGVVASDTVMVTALPAPAAMLPKLQVSKLVAETPHDPRLVPTVAADQFSPPAVGNWSLRLTLVAVLPAAPSLLTTMVKLTAPP